MCARKYIRFTSPFRARQTRGALTGVFQPAYALRDGYRPIGGEAAAPWLRRAIAEEIAWFCDELDKPSRFGVVTRKSKRPYAGVCWFRDEAGECLTHANTLAALVEEGGVPIERHETDAPGQIVFRDDKQIVAIPEWR